MGAYYIIKKIMQTTRTTKYRYNDMLEVLPPAAQSNLAEYAAFLVGEPTTHKEGRPVYSSYFTDGEQYVTGPDISTVEFYDIMRDEKLLATMLRTADEPADDSDDARILEAVEEHGADIVEAYADAFGGMQYVTVDKISDAYTGQYDSDEEFARDMAEQTDAVKDDAQWPYTCIDWERAARELMYDYTESNGYYFNNY